MKDILETARSAARAAGKLIMTEFATERRVDAAEAHDIKLALDRESQALITRILLDAFPDHAVLGEEGSAGTEGSEWEWIVDPIDGTVNYYYGIPHFCISIAARRAGEIVAGVILDPVRDELWEASEGGPALLNGRPCRASERTELADAVVSIGFSKTNETINAGMPLLAKMANRVRKCRMLGSAALDIAYVACGRLDAYVESAVSIWDVAAGKIILERAGGRIEFTGSVASEKMGVRAWNGRIDLNLP